MKPNIKLKCAATDKKIKSDTYKEKIDIQQKKITKHKNDIWIPKDDLKMNSIKTKSWFSLTESFPKKNPPFIANNFMTDNLNNVSHKSKIVRLWLNDRQKSIINKWLDAYLEMYNVAIDHIKNNDINDFQKLRSLLKEERNAIIEKSKTQEINMSNIKTHDIDGAIKLACTMHKSALTNKKNGYIKSFRLRKWKKSKKIKIIDLEKEGFSKKGLRYRVLGKIDAYCGNEVFDFGNIGHDCKLQKKNGKYYLFVPERVSIENNKNENKQIALDPGIRTFLTGITENKIVKIGENCEERIKKLLERRDKISGNAKIKRKIKKKNVRIINMKIKHLVDELHWKSILYLTNQNNIILMGNMSTKSIVSKNGNLNKMTKRIALALRLYKFRERMKYKCYCKNVEYGGIDEWMTSKMCSNCGNIKKDLGGKKIYECEKCKIVIDRDVNGARNIYIKGIK